MISDKIVSWDCDDRVSHKTRNPRKKKQPKSSSKVGLGESRKVGQKVGLEVGCPV